MANPWDNDPIVADTPFPSIVVGRRDPSKDRSERREDQRLDIAEGADARTAQNTNLDNLSKARSDFNGLQAVKDYKAVLPLLMSGLQSAPNPQGDNALIYAYAKVMDPGSVVRESEGQMAANTASFWDAKVEQLKKNLGYDGARGLPAGAAQGLRVEMNRKVAQLAKAYGIERLNAQEFAAANGLPPEQIVGRPPAEPFIERYKQIMGTDATIDEAPPPAPGNAQLPVDDTDFRNSDEYREWYKRNHNGESPPLAVSVTGEIDPNAPPEPGSYEDSYTSQGLSGVNEGIANTLGGPVDLMNAGLNLGAQGINAIANTDLSVSDRPFAGSQFWKDLMAQYGVTGAETEDPGKRFLRRAGQSVGSIVIPTAATARTGAQALAALASGTGGGIGAATAQEVAPGNPYAEIIGELVGGGLPALTSLGRARSMAQRDIEAAVPTVDDLKQQAGDMYRLAEARGVTASPQQTQQLQTNFGDILRREGVVSPTGRISEVHPKVKESYQLATDYAQGPMNPTQMQTVRGVLADASGSVDKNERRMGGLLTEAFDNWADPLAPELPQARAIASKYINAEKLEQARELAGARAGQFSGSGFENALRTEYRAIDRNAIKGKERGLNPDVIEAVEAVNRGTPSSNFMRAIGKLAPTSAVSFGLGSGVPAMIGTMMGGPAVGIGVGAGTAALGHTARAAATSMTSRQATLAELMARNGGALPEPSYLTPEIQRLIAAGVIGQGANYLTNAK